MARIFLATLTMTLMLLFGALSATAQSPTIQSILQENEAIIAKSSRKTIEPAIDAIRDSGLSGARDVLEKWQAKELWQRKDDKQFFFARANEDKTYTLIDIETGADVEAVEKNTLKQIKPNSGIRAMIGAALVQFQLLADDPLVRSESLDAIQRDPNATHLPALRGAIDGETDPAIKERKERLLRLLTVQFETDPALRIDAIESLRGDLGVDARAALNPILATTRVAAIDRPDGNPAAPLTVGKDLTEDEAYDLLVAADLALPVPTAAEMRAALSDNIVGGKVGGIPTSQLNTEENRTAAYAALAEAGAVPFFIDAAEKSAAVAAHSYFDTYIETNADVTTAAADVLDAINLKVGASTALDLGLDALSLASIFFLAAIGLAITFGVMGVINMAHGEFIMLGAYTGYVVQQFITNYTVSIIVALPLAFAVTFAAGVLMERLVIRHLYNRPLETLLATFGISIALQQLAKNIFGTQARPLTSPGWLDGALVFNDVVAISYIRIAIFVLALIFLALFLFIMKRTRLGLEVRAVTQNPRMAASMGINPDKINMMTFGLGSGIAGIAGVAIGLFAKVTSELGSDYIVQSFMTVVVGGVGNIWGTLAGATMIGFLQKGIEWMNPGNTLAAQTFMIIFIIIFIQFRPKGIIALKGRAAGD